MRSLILATILATAAGPVFAHSGAVTDRPIRFLVNTHYHGDHTRGNPVFVKLAEIVAHDTVRPRLLEYPETVKKTFPERKRRIQEEIDAIKDASDPYRIALEKGLGLLDVVYDEVTSVR